MLRARFRSRTYMNVEDCYELWHKMFEFVIFWRLIRHRQYAYALNLRKINKWGRQNIRWKNWSAESEPRSPGAQWRLSYFCYEICVNYVFLGFQFIGHELHFPHEPRSTFGCASSASALLLIEIFYRQSSFLENTDFNTIYLLTFDIWYGARCSLSQGK